MGGNVERHIGDDDRYGAAIEVMRDAEPTSDDVSFQDRVDPWMQACFGAEISADKLERGDRLLEDVLKLLQSGDYPSERIAALTKYVWSREIGEPAQEVGGVMVTLAAYCLAHGLNMHTAGETELTRIWTKVDKIRAKQAAKPKGSPLPLAWSESNTPDAEAYRDEALAQVASLTPDDLIDLIGEFGREVYHLLDDCETSGPVGEEIHTITEDGLRKVSAILDRLEALPFEEPGVMLGTGAMLQAAIRQTFAHTPPRTGGRRQMKVLIVGGPNRGQVVDVEATPSNMLELVQVRDPVRGEAYWFKVEADVKDKHSYVIGELCRAYEFVTKGETRRQHVGENGKL